MVPKADWTGIGPAWGPLSGWRMVVFGVYSFKSQPYWWWHGLQRWSDIDLRRSSSRFIDHLCPDAFGLENEFDGFADGAMPGEVLGNVVRGFFNFGDSIAYGNGKADAAH